MAPERARTGAGESTHGRRREHALPLWWAELALPLRSTKPSVERGPRECQLQLLWPATHAHAQSSQKSPADQVAPNRIIE
jgi:hypothetical protein